MESRTGGQDPHASSRDAKKKAATADTDRWAKALLEGMAEGFLAVDNAGRLTYVNSAVERVVGRKRDELLGRNVWDVFPEATGFEFFWHYQRMVTRRMPVQFEAFYPPLQMWLEVRLSPLADGGMAAYVGDISERKHLEEQRQELLEREQAARSAAAETERRFHRLMEADVIGIVIGEDNRILEANDTFLRLIGYTRADFVAGGLEWQTITPSEYASVDARAYQDLLAYGEYSPFEKELRRKDGTRVPVLVGGALLDRNAEQSVTFVIEQTERKRLERELAGRVAQLQAIFEAVGDGLAVYDAQGRIIGANGTFRKLLGQMTDQQITGNTLEEQMAHLRLWDTAGHPLTRTDWPQMRALRGEVLVGERAIEVVGRASDGREIYVNVGSAPLRDADGQITGAVCMCRDVSARRLLERQRVDILRIVAHDLGNPLAAMRMYVQMRQRRLREGRTPSPEVENEALQSMTYATDRMERLLNDLRVAATIETGALDLERTPSDLAALCRREALVQQATDREVRVDIPDEPVNLDFDAIRIGQVVGNLLSNAHKYSPVDRPIELSVQTDTMAGVARVTVRDYGPGIPREEQEQIWDQFHRAKGISTVERSTLSLGLGLFICRAIVEQHGGEIGVESEVGQGSTFWFTLPLP
jgi:PAS domain S-box-containing protein